MESKGRQKRRKFLVNNYGNDNNEEFHGLHMTQSFEVELFEVCVVLSGWVENIWIG